MNQQERIAEQLKHFTIIVPPHIKVDRQRFEAALFSADREMYPIGTICACCELPWGFHFGEVCPSKLRKNPSEPFVVRGTYFLPLLEVEDIPMEFDPA
jgi:hypothetical protein